MQICHCGDKTLDAPCLVPETNEAKKPITAQERQREREEKRRRRQERAREKEKKQKEKERRDIKKAEGFGGLVLSENDKNLLERWTRMIDQTHQVSLPLSQNVPVPKPAGMCPVTPPLPPPTVFSVSNINPVPEVRSQQNSAVTAPSVTPNIQFMPRCITPCPVPNLLHYVPPVSPAFQIGPVVLAPHAKPVTPPVPAQIPPDVKYIPGGQVLPGAFPVPSRVNPTWNREGHPDGWPAPDTTDGKSSSITVDPAFFLRNPTDLERPTQQVTGLTFPGGVVDCRIQEENKSQDLVPLPTTTFSTTDTSTTSPDINLVTQQLSRSQVEDVLPPVFSVTPKGSGAGYGVGFDLEEFLNQSFEMTQENRESLVDSTPSSARSWLTGLDVHRMNPATLPLCRRTSR
ncbi:hypothetical protein GDO81_024242 [Engystomops pustulosus]|uniref:BZIP domain-containing protein n=1 Tax=Engystomops pustulosus TaxID=76066 RepID=A0AAV6ZKT0_ENGPU|nr:hypothetical protein GDO81_024242 [Engystomops pustulosus]